MKLERIPGRRLCYALCATLALAFGARAQEPRAEKLSEYVNQFTSCNAGAHLDNLAIYLQNNPNTTGHIRVYGPGGPEDKYGERAVRATKNYLVATRGIEESRVQAVYAGRYRTIKEVLTELWLVPEGAEPPPVTKYKSDLGFEGQFFKMGLWDGPDEGEGWSNSTEVAFVGLSEMLRSRADARVYLVAYHDAESAPGTWRRVAERETEKLRGHGVPSERMKVIFGGYAKDESLQVWILPAGAPPPAKARRERRPERSVRIASLDDSWFKYGDGDDWAFKGFADVLKADGQLRGCLVIRLAPAEAKDADPERPVDPDEPPDVDLMQLAEEWKAKLKKNGVGEHRLIVVVAPTRDGQWGGELETWVVPPGALLPDPSADDAESVEEGEAENPKEF
jgi:hypothetical protein